MNQFDACRILNISGDYTPETVKKAYRIACKKYHPDRNPAGLEMMKLVNSAYEFLKAETGSSTVNQETDYSQALMDALNAVIGLPGLVVELCGAWAWVSGDTKQHKEKLKEHKFKWARKKCMWYFRPDDARVFSNGKKTMDEIRAKYGSKSFGQDRLSA